ncbi:hypothetical protein U1Q18_043922 [Sarracenia purpurea var. burkii]
MHYNIYNIPMQYGEYSCLGKAPIIASFYFYYLELGKHIEIYGVFSAALSGDCWLLVMICAPCLLMGCCYGAAYLGEVLQEGVRVDRAWVCNLQVAPDVIKPAGDQVALFLESWHCVGGACHWEDLQGPATAIWKSLWVLDAAMGCAAAISTRTYPGGMVLGLRYCCCAASIKFVLRGGMELLLYASARC